MPVMCVPTYRHAWPVTTQRCPLQKMVRLSIGGLLSVPIPHLLN